MPTAANLEERAIWRICGHPRYTGDVRCYQCEVNETVLIAYCRGLLPTDAQVLPT